MLVFIVSDNKAIQPELGFEYWRKRLFIYIYFPPFIHLLFLSNAKPDRDLFVMAFILQLFSSVISIDMHIAADWWVTKNTNIILDENDLLERIYDII